MVCGVNLGILVACLVQVEYVRCFWETNGKGFKKPTYNPFTQGRLRQASFLAGFDQSLNQGLPSSSYSEAAPKLTQNGNTRVQYVKSKSNLQERNRGVLEKWEPQESGLASASFVGVYGSHDRTDSTAVRNSPVPGSQGQELDMSSSGSSQSSRESYTFRKPPMTAAEAKADLKNMVHTSVTVRGKLVRKLLNNQRKGFPFYPVQVNQYPSSRRLYNGYSWSQPQSNFNQDASTVTYKVADEYGGSFIIRLKNKDQREEVGPLEIQRSPQQTVFHPNQGQKLPKSVWRKVKSKSNLTPLN